MNQLARIILIKEHVYRLLCLICLLLASLSSYASHLFGGELFYTHISGNTYKITMILYGDCGGSVQAFQGLTTATPQIEIYNGAKLIYTIPLSPQGGSGINVSPVCPDEASNTTCSPNGTLPGVKKFIYAANIDLGVTSANWKFRSLGDLGNNTQAGRSNSITNVTTINSLMSLEATLNNISSPNSSPTYTTIPTPFFCLNKAQEYNQGAVDPNGDSLYFSLVPGLNATTTPSTTVTYVNPTMPTAPLLCAPGTYSFNNYTGQLSFLPNVGQNALVVSKVSEYRNGILVGTSMREMTFVVLSSCNNNPPDGKIISVSNGTIVNNRTIKVCKGNFILSAKIQSSDLDGDNVNLTYQGLPTGMTALVNSNNTPTPAFSLSWNIATVAIGSYTFYLTYNDDGCPLSSRQTVAYTIEVLPVPDIIYNLAAQATCNQKAVFTITPPGQDLPYKLNVMQGNNSVLIVNTINSIATDSLAPGTYTFRVTGAGGCFKDTTITLIQSSFITPQISWTAPYCPAGNTGTITVSGTGSHPSFQYSVNTSAYTTGNTFTGLTAGNHTVHIKDALGCIKDSNITILPPSGMHLSLDIRKPVCTPVSDGQITLTASNGNGAYLYALNSGAYAASPTFSGLASGSYTLHAKDAKDCVKDTVIVLTDSLTMNVQAIVTNVMCNGSGNGSVNLNPSGTTAPYSFALGSGSWTTNSTFNSLDIGSYLFHIKDQNQCLKDTTIRITQPEPLAFNLTLTPIACKGESNGKIIVTAKGGTPAYQYAVDNNTFQAGNQLTHLTAGTHTIRLKDLNGCTRDTSISLTEPATSLSFGTFLITNPTCEGYKDGMVTLLSEGGNPPYQFALNNGTFTSSPVFKQLEEGTLQFRVKDDHGCTKDTFVTLTGFPHILIDQVRFDLPSCYGYDDGSISLKASGGNPPFQYDLGNNAWRSLPGFENLKSEQYTLRIKDSKECIKDTLVNLEQPDLLVVDTLSIGNDCNGVNNGGMIEVTVSGGTAPYTYFWAHDPDNRASRTIGLLNGNYQINVADAQGCTDSAQITIGYNNCCVPYIPNAFTPNNDGLNDFYNIDYKGDMDLKEMHIFNRYGQRIFFASSLGKGWDGTQNGLPVDPGTYYYYIRILCGNILKKEMVFKGDISLIR